MWLFYQKEFINLKTVKFIAMEQNVRGDWYLAAYFIDNNLYKLTHPTDYNVCACILRNLKSKIIHKDEFIELIGIDEAKKRLECVEGVNV